MKPTSKYKGYFESQLAARASRDKVAAPATPDTLAKAVNYLSKEQILQVEAACEFATNAHDAQMRRTGHTYITHPLAVASILAEMRMDHHSIIAALLHDVLEDTGTNKRTIKKRFSKEVAEIVDGVSKLAKIFQSRAEAQAENFQKMALATAHDLRVILVKLADRLHNMRTIGVLPPERRKSIARETLDFYAPIADRLGMHNMKTELEDLGFEALFPLRADRIGRAVITARGNRKSLMDELRKSISAGLRREGIEATVLGREKNLYSIYRKMKTQRKSFHRIVDVFGFRVIVDQVDTCYRALGIVHNMYKPRAGYFKDYIAIPKANGYQSLHSSLVGMNGVPIEVQIRTRQMNTIADNGIAGHWLYKSPSASYQANEARAREWLKSLLDLQKRTGNSLEFIEHLKTDLFPHDVYIFTRDGDIFELARGASPIDFAYAIHTDIGNQTVACRIDGASAPLSRQLTSGQTVEIITAKDARPSPDWLTFTVSGRARSAIRQALKAQKRSESIRLGRRLLDRSLSNANISVKDLDFRRMRKILREFKVRRVNRLLEEIGLGNLMSYVVAQRLLAAENPEYQGINVEHGGPVAIKGGEGLVISYARCCGPVPGDPVVGHMTPGRGFVVHLEDCNNVTEMLRRTPQEIIPASWSDESQEEFETTLRLTVNRRKGVVAELATSMNNVDAGINNIIVDERSAELSSVTLEISVHDRDQLIRAIQRLHALPSVQTVDRIAA